MKHRLFIAIPIPGSIRHSIVNAVELPDDFKVTNPDNIHITLFFLGDTEEQLIEQIIPHIKNAVAGIDPFELEISHTGQFPRRGYPRIIYATGYKGKKKLLHIASTLREGLKTMDITDNKDFKYHITIGRNKRRYGGHGHFTLPDFPHTLEFTVEKVILYKSELQPGGPIYTPLYTEVLGG